jgi:hypothetical protein
MNIKCISPYIHQVLFETNFWEPAEKLYVMDTLESRRAWVPRDDGAYESAADLPHWSLMRNYYKAYTYIKATETKVNQTRPILLNNAQATLWRALMQAW